MSAFTNYKVHETFFKSLGVDSFSMGLWGPLICLFFYSLQHRCLELLHQFTVRVNFRLD